MFLLKSYTATVVLRGFKAGCNVIYLFIILFLCQSYSRSLAAFVRVGIFFYHVFISVGAGSREYV